MFVFFYIFSRCTRGPSCIVSYELHYSLWSLCWTRSGLFCPFQCTRGPFSPVLFSPVLACTPMFTPVSVLSLLVHSGPVLQVLARWPGRRWRRVRILFILFAFSFYCLPPRNTRPRGALVVPPKPVVGCSIQGALQRYVHSLGLRVNQVDVKLKPLSR